MFCWDQGDCNALWFLSCLSWPWFDVSHDDISLQLHSQRYMLWTIKFKVSGLDETEQRGVPQTLCFLSKQEERRHRHEIALKSEISAAVSSFIFMKGYSNDDIKDRKEQRASKMTKWKWVPKKKAVLEQIVGLNQRGKCDPAVFCKQMHGFDFQIFAPSDSPRKVSKWSNGQLCGPRCVDDIPRSGIHSVSAD